MIREPMPRHEIIAKMEDALTEMDASLADLRDTATKSITAKCDYEDLKNQYVLQLKDEELADPKQKRTIPERESTYRLQYKDERREWLVQDTLHDVNKTAVRVVEKKANLLQSLLKSTETEYSVGNLRGA